MLEERDNILKSKQMWINSLEEIEICWCFLDFGQGIPFHCCGSCGVQN
jgi:hypothetical protein